MLIRPTLVPLGWALPMRASCPRSGRGLLGFRGPRLSDGKHITHVRYKRPLGRPSQAGNHTQTHMACWISINQYFSPYLFIISALNTLSNTLTDTLGCDSGTDVGVVLFQDIIVTLDGSNRVAWGRDHLWGESELIRLEIFCSGLKSDPWWDIVSGASECVTTPLNIF